MKEANRQNEIMIALSKIGAKIFRNNVGIGWAGKAERQSSTRMVKVFPGDVVVRQARPLHAGLCKGSSDLIGWLPVLITPEMVGKKVAVFLGPEIKTDTGRPTKEQINFIDTVNRDGGRAGIARCADDAVKIALDDE